MLPGVADQRMPPNDLHAPAQRRPVGATLLAVLYALACGSALRETIDHLVLSNDDPAVLGALQALTAGAALVAALGIWRRARWATSAVIAYGVIAGTMVMLLGPILDLDAEARPGLWVGAAMILVFTAASAWYVRRVTQRDTVPKSEAVERPV